MIFELTQKRIVKAELLTNEQVELFFANLDFNKMLEKKPIDFIMIGHILTNHLKLKVVSDETERKIMVSIE